MNHLGVVLVSNISKISNLLENYLIRQTVNYTFLLDYSSKRDTHSMLTVPNC